MTVRAEGDAIDATSVSLPAVYELGAGDVPQV